MMKNYPRKELACLALTPLVILLFGVICFVILDTLKPSSTPEFITTIGILTIIVCITSLIFIPVYLLLSF